MDIIIKKYGFKEGLTTRSGEIVNWPYNEPQPTQEEIGLLIAKDAKKTEIKAQRNNEFCKPLLVRSAPDVYLKPQPQVNIFLAAYSMADGTSKEWYVCDIDGNMLDVSIEATKDELINVANHYEDRKTNEYNQCRKRCSTVDALTTIAEVEAFNITEVIV